MVHRTQESSQSPTVPDLPQCSSAEMCGLLRRVVLTAASPQCGQQPLVHTSGVLHLHHLSTFPSCLGAQQCRLGPATVQHRYHGRESRQKGFYSKWRLLPYRKKK